MRTVITNVIDIRLKHGLSKEEIIQGMFHTICEHLDISKDNAIRIIHEGEIDTSLYRDRVAALLKSIKNSSDSRNNGDGGDGGEGGSVRRGLYSLLTPLPPPSKTGS